MQKEHNPINIIEYMRALFYDEIGFDEFANKYYIKRGKMKNIIRFFVHRKNEIKNGEFNAECQYMAHYLNNPEIDNLWNNAHINFIAHFNAKPVGVKLEDYSQDIYEVRVLIEKSIKDQF